MAAFSNFHIIVTRLHRVAASNLQAVSQFHVPLVAEFAEGPPRRM